MKQEGILVGILLGVLLMLILRAGWRIVTHWPRPILEKTTPEEITVVHGETRNTVKRKSKNPYLTAMSHDLRQPLHAIGFFVEALRHETDTDKIKTLAGKIGLAADNLKNLVSALLDMSRLEAGAMEPSRTDFDLNELFRDIVTEFAPLAQDKGLDLDIGADTDIIQPVHSDRDMLGRILRNLVSNAIRYTDAGQVNISGTIECGTVVIHVADSGRGIAESNKDDIFTEFFRADDTGQSLGAGLGLPIARGLCQLLQHDLSFHSAVGMGSVFSVTIPRNTPVTSTTEPSSDSSKPEKTRIILLARSRTTRSTIGHMLQSWGHVVMAFSEEKTATDFLHSEDIIPDLIFVDEADFRAEALQAAIELSELATKPVPVILLSHQIKNRPKNQALPPTVSILPKPLQPAKLRSLVTYLT